MILDWKDAPLEGMIRKYAVIDSETIYLYSFENHNDYQFYHGENFLGGLHCYEFGEQQEEEALRCLIYPYFKKKAKSYNNICEWLHNNLYQVINDGIQ